MQILINQNIVPQLFSASAATPGTIGPGTIGTVEACNIYRQIFKSKYCFFTILTTLWSSISLLFASSLALAETTEARNISPTPFTAIYRVTKGIMSVGTTKRSLKATGDDNYLFESITKPGGIAKLFTSGKVIERSYWRLVDNKLVPQMYEYINSSDNKRNVTVKFDWENNKVTNTVNGDPWSMEIEDETLDKLIYQLAIMYDLSQGQTRLLYQVADGGRSKTYDIKNKGPERVISELGVFDTIKISRTSNDRTTTMWCAENLQYLPVKIEQKTDDGSVTAELIELSGIEIPKESQPVKKQPAQ